MGCCRESLLFLVHSSTKARVPEAIRVCQRALGSGQRFVPFKAVSVTLLVGSLPSRNSSCGEALGLK